MRTFYLLLIVMHYSLYAVAQPEAHKYTDNQKLIIFSDDFQNNSKNWSVGYNSSAGTSFKIDNGYYMTSSMTGNVAVSWQDIHIPSDQDFEMEVNFTLTNSRNSGINVELFNGNCYYRFAIKKNMKKGSVNCYIGPRNAQDDNIFNSLNSVNINLLDHNKLIIQKVSDHLYYFINEDLIHSSAFNSVPFFNRIGISPYWFSSINVNNIKIYIINDRINFDTNLVKGKSIAFLPIQCMDFKAESLAKKLKNELTSKIREFGYFNFIQDDFIYNTMNRYDIRLYKMNKYDAIQLGKALGADIMILAFMNEYSEEENYIGMADQTNYTADAYKRSLSSEIEIQGIMVNSGLSFKNITKAFSFENQGYKNIRAKQSAANSYSDGTTTGAFLGLLSATAELTSETAAQAAQRYQLLPFSDMENQFINEAKNFFFYDLICSNDLYNKEYYYKKYDEQLADTELLPEENKIVENDNVKSDIDVQIPFNNIDNFNTYALIIGNENYKEFQSSLSFEQNVLFAENDAKIFREYCIQTLGIPENNIILELNAGFIRMQQAIKQINSIIKNKNGEANVIVYYAGHGLPNEVTKEPFLVPVDVPASSLDYAINLNDFYKKLTEYPAKKIIVFLDACFTGGGRQDGLLSSRGIKVIPNETSLNANLVVFCSSSSNQSSLPFKEKQHGLFTYYLLKKIKDTNGGVTLAELEKYLGTEVPINSVIVNKVEQNPRIHYSSMIENEWETWKLR